MIMECEGTKRKLSIYTQTNGRRHLVDCEVFTATSNRVNRGKKESNRHKPFFVKVENIVLVVMAPSEAAKINL